MDGEIRPAGSSGGVVKYQELSWVACDGGPHLLLPVDLISFWHGSDDEMDFEPVRVQLPGSSSPVEFSTHYDLACSVRDPLGAVAVGDGNALVIAGDVSESTWIGSAKFDGGYVVVPDYCPDDFDFLQAAENLQETIFKELPMEISTKDGGLLLLSACDAAPDWCYPHLKIKCSPGIYGAATAEISAPDLHVIFHRIRRRDLR